MALPKNYSECLDDACGGIYKNTESNTLGLCRRCREAEISRSLRMGLGEPKTEKAGGGYRVVRSRMED